MKICDICQKKALNGNSIAIRGLAKSKGGVGIKTTGITKRRFQPNLQKLRIKFPSGTIKTVKVCTRCIKAGKVVKAA